MRKQIQRIVYGALAAVLVFVAGYFAAGRGGSDKPDAPIKADGFVTMDPGSGGTVVTTPPPKGQDAAPKATQTSYAVANPMDGQGVQRRPAGDGMQEVTIIDSQGFGQPMNVGTVSIPADWKTRGGVTWDRRGQCVGNMMRMSWAAFSPDGQQGFEIRPGYNWQVQGTEIQMNPCAPMPIRSVRDYLSMVVQQRYGDRARMLDYRDRPEIAQGMKQNGPLPPNMKAWNEAGQMLIAFTLDGKEFRESLLTLIFFSESQGNVVGGTANIYAQHAPNGQLDLELGERIRKSMRPNMQWVQMFGQAGQDAADRIGAEQRNGITKWHNDRMTEINLKGARDRSQIRMQTQREVSQIYSDTWKSTQDTNDRMHRRSLEAVGEYNTYRDSTTNAPVRATIHNNHVWRVGDGNYVSTNDPNFSPTNGVQLRRIP